MIQSEGFQATYLADYTFTHFCGQNDGLAFFASSTDAETQYIPPASAGNGSKKKKKIQREFNNRKYLRPYAFSLHRGKSLESIVFVFIKSVLNTNRMKGVN